jgi:hypothetical protein
MILAGCGRRRLGNIRPFDTVSIVADSQGTGADVKGPGHDSSLLRQAMMTGIAQRLKTECNPPTDLTPELRNILRRLEEQKDKET